MTDFEDMNNRELRASHEFAVKRIELELLNGEVPDALYAQLGKVCFELMIRQMDDGPTPA